MTPSITDWLMVGITLVYVVATIFICWANLKSAKASKEQLHEMKVQYAEDNRPRVEVEFCYEKRTWYIIRLVNHGKRTAQHVQILLDDDFVESLPEQGFKETLRKQRNKQCIIGVDQHYDLYIASNELRGNLNMRPVTGIIKYTDNETQYECDIFIDLEKYMTFFSSTSEEENLLKEIKKNKEEIKEIKVALQKIAVQKEEDNNV